MNRTRQERFRLGLVFAVLCLFFAAFVVRLVHLQVFNSGRYGDIVTDQSSSQVTIPAPRGIICDRAGRIVVNNVVRSSLYAWPASGKELRDVATYLERLFDLPSGTAQRKFNLRTCRFSYIKRRMSDQLARRIEREAPRGLYLRESSHRTYPYGTVGKQLLGFTDIDNKGQAGIEFSFDSLLAGRVGTADVYRDGRQRVLRVQEQALIEPQAGTSMVLAADWRLQEIVEEELHRAVDSFNAKSAMAAFVDCATGDILALAHHDPNERHPEKPIKLRAVTDQFEPGSVFKVITAAAILDAGLVDYDDSIYCEGGKWKTGRRILHDDKEHDSLVFRQIMELSSNIGIGKLALELGGEELYCAAERFGFGSRLGLGLPGETGGALPRPNRWSISTTSQLAMGHAVATNTVQLAMAIAAIANGGELLKPRLILGHLDKDCGLEREAQREVVGRVMNREAADSLRAILRGVVEVGTATPVNSDIVTIAGKTGTAQIPDLENHRYYHNRYMASFGGFFPADKPLIAGLVVLEDPQPIHYGGYTAGPAFRRIAERYAVLNPDKFINPDQMLASIDEHFDKAVEVPDFVGHTWDYARRLAEREQVLVRGSADSGVVTWQFPPAGRLMFRGDDVILAVSEPESSQFGMADLCGLSMRQAAAFLNHVGVTFHVAGHGTVVKQSVEAGTPVGGRTFCQLECR